MIPKDLLDRIAALIARAEAPPGDARGEEARTAAWKACALMREHGLVLALEDGEVLVTRPLRAPEPARAVRRSREHKTVIVFRCAHCGRQVAKPGVPCATCAQRHVPMGIWTVDCQGCGRSTPPGRNEMEVNEIALNLGFTVTDEGLTLCPVCTKRRKTA